MSPQVAADPTRNANVTVDGSARCTRAQCFRGSLTEQLTILTGKPAKVHEPPTARNHRYRDRVRRVSGEFCVHTV